MTYSDASFRKETEFKGYGMRGTVILRLGKHKGVDICLIQRAAHFHLRRWLLLDQ